MQKKSSQAWFVAGLLALCAGTTLFAPAPALAQTAITAGGDGTGVSFDAATQTYTINGGTQIDANLFHSFQRFGLNTSEIANFLAQPNVMNILARVTGGEASVIDGLLRVSGGDNANLFILNPAGVLLGRNARLDLAGSFSVSSASGMAFGDEVLSATGANNYSALTGNPTGYIFLGPEGTVLNEADLAVAPGQSLTLAGSTVVNTGTLSAPGGTISIAAVPDGLLQISQEGLLIRLAVPTEQVQALAAGNGVTALDLPGLLAGEWGGRATTVTTAADGSVVLASGAAVATAPGGVTLAGAVDATDGQVGLTADRVVVAREIGTPKGVGSGAAPMAVTLNLGDETTAGRLEILPTGFLRVEELTLASPMGIVIDNARADGLHGTTLNLRSAIELENYGFNPSTVVNVGVGSSVQDGVYAVDAGGTVNLAAGTYTEGNTIVIDRALTLNGQGADQTTLSGNNAYRVLEIAYSTTGTVNIDNLTILDGNTIDNGGGIRNDSNATLDLNNSTVSNNTIQNSNSNYWYGSSSYGGGIYSNGVLTLNNSTVSNNTIQNSNSNYWYGNSSYGGGIYSNDAVTLNNSTLSNNIIQSDIYGYGYGQGGGIYSNGSVTLNDSTVAQNTAQYFGGIYSGGAVTLDNSTVSNNTAQYYSGGIYSNGAVTLNDSTVSNNTVQNGSLGGIYSNSAVTLNNSTVSNNAAQNFGGIYSYGAVTLDNSTVSDNTAQYYYGGIYSNSNVMLDNSTVSNNAAQDFGGIYSSGAVTLNDSTVSNNTAQQSHGGIYSSGAVTLDNSTVSDNTAQNGSYGGIYSNSNVMLDNSTVSNNAAQNFGGIYSYGAVTLNDSTVSNNTAQQSYGGIYSSGAVTLDNSTVSDNTAQNGSYGGIYSNDAVTLDNSTVSNNTAQQSYGGIYSGGALMLNNSTVSNNAAQYNFGGIYSYGAVTLENSTIAFNSSQNEGGGLTVGGNNTHTFTNSIIASNTSPVGPDVYVEADKYSFFEHDFLIEGNNNAFNIEANNHTFNVSHSLIGSTDGMTGIGVPTNGVNGNLVGVDPLLGPLRNNGGPTQTHALLPGSPAINAGDPAYSGPLTTDQRGEVRVQRGRIDIGAFESDLAPPPPVEPPPVEPPAVEPPAVAPPAAQVSFSQWPLNRVPAFVGDRVPGSLRFTLSPELAQDLGLPIDEPPAGFETPDNGPAVNADPNDASDDSVPICLPDATEGDDLDACL